MAPSRKRSKALVELFPDLGPPPDAAPQAARTLLEMARAIPLAPTVGEAQRVQLQHVAALLAPKSCFVAQHAPGREQLQIAAVRGRNDARIAAARPGEGLAGQAYAQGRIVREDGALAIPIVGTSGSLGVLVVLGPRFDVPDVLAEALAAQLLTTDARLGRAALGLVDVVATS